MKNVANFTLYHVAWFVAVVGAARGAMWSGPVAMAVVIAIHLALLPDRGRELRFLLCVGVLGSLADTGLAAVGATAYPTSAREWPMPWVPPWITALWIGFATLPRFSLAWLARRPWLAAVLGAVGGPLAYLGGVRLGAVAVGPDPALTWLALAGEYALALPLLVRLAPARSDRRRTPPVVARGSRLGAAAHDVPRAIAPPRSADTATRRT